MRILVYQVLAIQQHLVYNTNGLFMIFCEAQVISHYIADLLLIQIFHEDLGGGLDFLIEDGVFLDNFLKFTLESGPHLLFVLYGIFFAV